MKSQKNTIIYKELLNNILKKFMKLYREYMIDRILSSPNGAYFINLLKKGKYEPHDLLLHLLVKTGFELGIITLPEFKIPLEKPIDRCELGLTCNKDRRLIKSVKADVVFHITSQDLGIGEVVSGMLHHGYSSKELHEHLKKTRKKVDGEVTTRDKLLHLAKHNSEAKFFVLVIYIGNEERFHLRIRRRKWIDIWKKTIDELSKIRPTKVLFIRGIEKPRFEIYP